MLAVQVLTERAVWLPGIETVDKGFFNYKEKKEYKDKVLKSKRAVSDVGRGRARLHFYQGFFNFNFLMLQIYK